MSKIAFTWLVRPRLTMRHVVRTRALTAAQKASTGVVVAECGRRISIRPIAGHPTEWPERVCTACQKATRRTRGTTNGSARGSLRQRRVRRQWLLDTFGDGVKAPCHHCGVLVDIVTLSVDRITPGCDGGTYERGNIRPSCGPCNSITGGRTRRTKG